MDRRYRHAYNRGADDRGNGVKREDCPYSIVNGRDQAAWRKGWDDADKLMADQLALPVEATGWHK